MRKLIEQYRRRPEWEEDQGTWVTLSDGCPWSLARPWLEVRPVFRQGRCETYSRMLTTGDLDPLIEAVGQEEDGLPQAMSILTVGALLLQRRYDVDDDELSRLFILRPGDPDSDRMLREILDVATGHGLAALGWRILWDPKKLSAAG